MAPLSKEQILTQELVLKVKNSFPFAKKVESYAYFDAMLRCMRAVVYYDNKMLDSLGVSTFEAFKNLSKKVRKNLRSNLKLHKQALKQWKVENES